jgi:hypothetical protein
MIIKSTFCFRAFFKIVVATDPDESVWVQDSPFRKGAEIEGKLFPQCKPAISGAGPGKIFKSR